MLRTQHIEVVERLTDAWNSHDPDAVAACYARDAVSQDVTITEALHGRTAIRNAAAMYMRAFPDIRFEIRRVACDGDVVTAGSKPKRPTGMRPASTGSSERCPSWPTRPPADRGQPACGLPDI
jgi:uncharacterized protein (TIGR02246 family)